MSGPSTSEPKPPNVLIYQSDRDSTNADFIRAKKSLELCLTPERYVIYPLGVEDISRYSPWKENCRLLVVPPLTGHAQKAVSMDTGGSLPPRVMEELVSYLQAGGKVLSMQSDLNRLLGLVPLREAMEGISCDGRGSGRGLLEVYCPEKVCDVEPEVASGMERGCKFSCLVPGGDTTSTQDTGMENSRDEIYLTSLRKTTVILSSTDMAFSIPVEWNTDMAWLSHNSNQCNSNDQPADPSTLNLPSIPCVRSVELANGGGAVLASVDLSPVLPSNLEVSPLVRLKKGVALRGQYLARLLRGLGVECSEEQLPDLTHTFLICSDEV